MLPGALECHVDERFFAGARASQLSEPSLRSRKRPPAQRRVTVHFLIVFVEEILHASLQREPRIELPCSVNPHDRVVLRVEPSKHLRVDVTPVRGKRPPRKSSFLAISCARNGLRITPRNVIETAAPLLAFLSTPTGFPRLSRRASVRDGSARFRTGSPEFFLPHMAPQNPPVDRPPSFPPQP